MCMFDVHLVSCRSSGTVPESQLCWLCGPDKSIGAAPGEIVALLATYYPHPDGGKVWK